MTLVWKCLSFDKEAYGKIIEKIPLQIKKLYMKNEDTNRYVNLSEYILSLITHKQTIYTHHFNIT